MEHSIRHFQTKRICSYARSLLEASYGPDTSLTTDLIQISLEASILEMESKIPIYSLFYLENISHYKYHKLYFIIRAIRSSKGIKI